MLCLGGCFCLDAFLEAPRCSASYSSRKERHKTRSLGEVLDTDARMATVPRSPPPTPALLATLSAKYGSAADVEATRAAFLAVLSRGRAVAQSASPKPTHACPEAETCNTEGLVLEYVSIEVERGERCPLLLCRAAAAKSAVGAAAMPLRPVFVLHGTGKSLADLLALTLALALALGLALGLALTPTVTLPSP